MNNQTGFFMTLWMYIWSIIKNSLLYRVLRGIYDGISNSWQKSRIAGWFRVLHVRGGAEKSVVGKVFRCPFTFIEWLNKKAGDKLNDLIRRSLFFKMFKEFLDKCIALNLRFIGRMCCCGTLTIVAVRIFTRKHCGGVIIAAAIISFVMSLFDVNLTKCIKKSGIFKGICSVLDIEIKESDPSLTKDTGVDGYGFTPVIFGICFGAAGAFLHPYLMLIGIVGVFMAFLAVKNPTASVFMLVFAAPILPTMADVALSLLCIFSLIVYAIRKKDFKFKFDGIGLFIIAFLCIYAVSATTSFTPAKSLSICAIYFVFIAVYFVIINTVTSKEKLKGMLTVFVLSGTLVCLYGIAQYVFGWDTSQAWIDEEMFEDIKMRIYSTLGNPNVLGEYILLVLPAAIGLMWTNKKAISKVFYGGISAIMFLALILTFSRGCWIGILAAAAVFITFAAGKLWGLALIALPLLPIVLPDSIINRFTSIGDMKDSSTSYRVYIWMGTLAMMKDFWLSGIGMGQQAFTSVYPFYSYNGIVAPHSHNLFLQILVECGVAGIAAFLVIVLLLLRRVMAGYKYGGKGSVITTLTIALTGAICGFLVQGMFDNCFYNYRVMLVFWCVAAMIRACVYIAKDEYESSRK